MMFLDAAMVSTNNTLSVLPIVAAIVVAAIVLISVIKKMKRK